MGAALQPTLSNKKDGETRRVEYFADEKRVARSITSDSDGEKETHKRKAPKTPRELVSEILMVEDDPSVNPWTFRMWFIGIGVSVFGGFVGMFYRVTALTNIGPSLLLTHLSHSQYTFTWCL
jgi:YD repeat-containing protein